MDVLSFVVCCRVGACLLCFVVRLLFRVRYSLLLVGFPLFRCFLFDMCCVMLLVCCLFSFVGASCFVVCCVMCVVCLFLLSRVLLHVCRLLFVVVCCSLCVVCRSACVG